MLDGLPTSLVDGKLWLPMDFVARELSMESYRVRNSMEVIRLSAFRSKAGPAAEPLRGALRTCDARDAPTQSSVAVVVGGRGGAHPEASGARVSICRA